jgi:outer membrane protein assembly factor BamB
VAISRGLGSIEMLDPATGEVRWRYSRSDSDDQPHLYPTAGGRLLLASYDDLGYLLLDAETGRRKAAWPGGTRDHDIQNTDPLLTGQAVSKGSDKLRGVDNDGKARWTFEPGRCTSISAVATATTAVAFLGHSCGDTPDEMTALDLKTGDKLWNRAANWMETPVVAGGLVVGREADGRSGSEMRGTLVGMDARTGEVKWRWQLPGAWACKTRLEQAGERLVLVDCPTAATAKTQTVVTAIDAASGGVSWQRTAPVALTEWTRITVTSDARVVSTREISDDCWLDVIDEAGYHRTQLLAPVVCRRGVYAVGTLVLAGGDQSVIALR